MAKEGTYRDSHRDPNKGQVYDEHYATIPWRKFLWLREQKIILLILEKYFKGKDIHLLDFACGTGRITSFLENRVKTSTAVDVSNSMLAIAREKLKRAEIIKTDITIDDVLKGRKFNLITAFRFFLNAEPELRVVAMKALSELLAQDGYLVFNNHHNIGCPWIKWSYMRHRQKKPQSIYNVMSIREMRKLAEDAGLEIIEIYPVGYFHPPRILVPQMVTRTIENMVCRFKCLSGFSESPIAVCSWRYM